MSEFDKHGRRALFAMLDQAYLKGRPKMYCNRGLHYGSLNGRTGYLRIRSFGAYSKTNDLRALEGALDSIFSDRNLQGLVIDMRLSFGGSDELGLAIASRLAAKEYIAYAVQARSDPVDRDR
ncbi:MAG: S41 family peptidase [Acidobacteriota bacterium]|nr:S41 family peptidase [Acidobacteriota bacterium]